MSRLPALLLLALTMIGTARAEEGMWLPNAFPSAKVAETYGFAPDAQWLDHARLSALRLSVGCSAGFVSANGLVATNHHCVEDCLAQNSRKDADLTAQGFYAATPAEEKSCAGSLADRLLAITEVTDRVLAATKGQEGEALAAGLKSVKASLTSDCQGGDSKYHCEVVTLFSGARYDLYRYRRYNDLRLVFAPEDGIANFGGDPDNFEFPRYALDVAFLRAYDNGKPVDSKDAYFHFGARETVPGELLFTIGNPGRTERLYTVAQLEDERDRQLPQTLFYTAELRGMLRDFTRRGANEHRLGLPTLLDFENVLKEAKGSFAALVDPALIAAKRHGEADLRAHVAGNPDVAGAWDEIAKAVAWRRGISVRAALFERRMDSASDLLAAALTLVRAPVERAKPDGERLVEYSDGHFPALRDELVSDQLIVPEVEALTLGYWLRKLQEDLGPDDTDVRSLLAGRAPEDLGANLVKTTKLGSAPLRRKLLDGGAKAVEAARDPMLDFARLVDPIERGVRARLDTQYSAVIEAAGGRIGRAGFSVYGADHYPDATFTLRLSWGTVQGWSEDGKSVPPVTRFAGLYTRATGNDPFALPPRWVAAKAVLDPGTEFNFATTNDIVGGNSGSPVIDRDGTVVGLAFDGNIQSLGGDYGFDPAVNRSVVVSAVAIREALAKIYGAKALLDELGSGAP